MNQPLKQNTSSRYRTIDGLRGIAALAVVFYHLSGNLQPELSTLLPNVLNIVFSYGYLGVPVFFVISGFVISLSIGNSTITPKYFGNFVLRRSIRLDPTYWASIIIAIVLLNIKLQFLNMPTSTPSASNILAHMFYLQNILEIKPIISVIYWTLCLEVQFYLFYILTLWFSQKNTNTSLFSTHIILITLIGVLSIFTDHQLITIPIPGLFIASWHYFLMGVLVSNVIQKLPYSTTILALWICIEILFQLNVTIKAYSFAGIFTCLFIYILWKKNKLNSVFTRKEFQFLGKISYTLYLIHPDIGWKVISIGKLLLGNNVSPVMAGVLFIAGLISSILCAYLLHLLVEKPTLIFCNKLKTSKFREVCKLQKRKL